MNLSAFEKTLKKTLEILFLFMVFMVPLVFSTQANDPFWVVEKFFLKFSVSILAVLFIVYCLLKKQFPLIKTPYNIAFLIFIILNLTGIFAGVNVYAWSDRVFVNLSYMLIFYMTLWYLDGNGKNGLNKVLTNVLRSGFVMAAYGLIQAGGMDFLPWRTTFNGRAASTLGNPNFLAGHMVLLIPVAFALAAGQGSRLMKFIIFLASACMTAALFASQTRGAYIGFMVSVAVLFILMATFLKEEFRKNSKVIIAMAILTVILIGGFFAVKKDAVQRIADIISLKDDSARIRASLWKNTFYLIKDNPLFGTGAGNFYIKYPYYQSRSMSPAQFRQNDYYKSGHAHNDFIQFAAEYGIPGAGAMLLIFGLMFFTGIRYLKGPGVNGMLVSGVLAAFAGLMVHAFFNFPFQIVPTAAIFFVLAAAACHAQESSSARPANVNAYVAAVLVLAAAGFMAEAVLSARVYAADVYLRKARENEHFNRMYDAVTLASDAADMNPWNDENVFYYAQVLEKTGNNGKSFDTYRAVYALNGAHWETLNALFNFYAMRNDEKGRTETADKLYRISPYSEKAADAEGYALYAAGKFDDAVKVYEQAIQNTGESASLLSQLSACYGALGNVQKTLEYADKAVALDPSFKDAYFNRAVVYYRMKNLKAARENLLKILSMSPDDDKAKGLLKVMNDAGKK